MRFIYEMFIRFIKVYFCYLLTFSDKKHVMFIYILEKSYILTKKKENPEVDSLILLGCFFLYSDCTQLYTAILYIRYR